GRRHQNGEPHHKLAVPFWVKAALLDRSPVRRLADPALNCNANRHQRRRQVATERRIGQQWLALRAVWVAAGCRKPGPRISFDPDVGYRIELYDSHADLRFPVAVLPEVSAGVRPAMPVVRLDDQYGWRTKAGLASGPPTSATTTARPARRAGGPKEGR